MAQSHIYLQCSATLQTLYFNALYFSHQIDLQLEKCCLQQCTKLAGREISQ